MAFNDLFSGKYKSQYNLDTKFASVTGTTKDSAGAALGGVTVKCFVAATNAYVASAVSNGSGIYSVTAPTAPTACFCVAYKAGAPDVAGTTVNTLTGVGGY